MKSFVGTTIGTLALMVGTAAACADVLIVDHSGQTSAQSIRDQKAVNACADAFIARIAPGASVKSQVRLPPGSKPILSAWRPLVGIEVSMEARSATHALLARSTCSASYDARVTHLSTEVVAPDILARVPSSEIQLGLVSRL